ncbi:MAG: UDP-N-acetylglucosamine 2-epimerase [Bacteroidales bacterium]
MRKICVVTGSRAEYGLLFRLIKMINKSTVTQLQIIATNMHLSPLYDNTYKDIEADGFTIDKKIPILVDGNDDPNATLKSMSKALSGFADAYDELKPDLVVLLGDRYEILAAATAAHIERIPIAHISGGDVTEGAYDDAIRHSITKMSYLHFPSLEIYRKRVIQLGEQPERVFNVGSLGVDNIKRIKLLEKEEIENFIGLTLDQNTLLATYHPVTLDNTALKDIMDFLGALDERKDLKVLFTMPNSDAGGKVISEAIMKFVEDNSQRARAFKSMGVMRYLSAIKYVGTVVGNSSSGLFEVPSFGIPTLNIGDRQKGRIYSDSVFNCKTDKKSILNGLNIVLSEKFKQKAAKTQNPYDKPNTAETIFSIISTYPLYGNIQKTFYDL